MAWKPCVSVLSVCLSVHRPVLVNAISRDHIDRNSSNMAQIFTWTQDWTESILVVRGQRSRSLWLIELILSLNKLYANHDHILQKLCWLYWSSKEAVCFELLYSTNHIWNFVVHHKLFDFIDIDLQVTKIYSSLSVQYMSLDRHWFKLLWHTEAYKHEQLIEQILFFQSESYIDFNSSKISQLYVVNMYIYIYTWDFVDFVAADEDDTAWSKTQ